MRLKRRGQGQLKGVEKRAGCDLVNRGPVLRREGSLIRQQCNARCAYRGRGQEYYQPSLCGSWPSLGTSLSSLTHTLLIPPTFTEAYQQRSTAAFVVTSRSQWSPPCTMYMRTSGFFGDCMSRDVI